MKTSKQVRQTLAPVVESTEPAAQTSNMKSNSVMSADVRETVITLTFRSGAVIEFDAAKCAETIRARAEMHGFKQKLVDAAAIARGEGGKSASEADKFAAIVAVRDALYEGDWERRGEGQGTMLVRALMVVYPGKSREKLAEYVKSKSAAERKALEMRPDIAAELAKIRPAVDTAKLESELDAIE